MTNGIGNPTMQIGRQDQTFGRSHLMIFISSSKVEEYEHYESSYQCATPIGWRKELKY